VVFSSTIRGGEGAATIAIDERAGSPAGGQKIVVRSHREGNELQLSFWVIRATDADPEHSAWAIPGAANAGECSTELPSHERVDVRIAVSAAPRPDGGQSWRPTGEVLFQLRQGGDPSGAWRSICALPVQAAGASAASEGARVMISGGFGDGFDVSPARMSDYSPSVWCQFLVASSNFVFSGSAHPVPVAALALVRLATVGTVKWTDLTLVDAATAAPRRLQPDTAAIGTASVQELRVAILTQDSYDIAGRLRERPVVALLLGDGPDRTTARKTLWPDRPAGPNRGGHGRWRLMRILVRAGDVELGSLAKLFDEPLDATISSAPSDAKGMMLSISAPSTWTIA
jgi:hypothetical protein